MKSENVSSISLAAFVFLGLQIILYKLTRMNPVPDGGLASVIAYHFQAFMVLTFSVAVWVPLSVWLEKKSGKPGSAWGYGIILFFVTLMGFILFSYIRFTQMSEPVGLTFTPGESLSSRPEKTSQEISNFVQFSDSEIELQKNDETLRIVLKFRNLSKKDITQMDYIFVALESGRIFYRINIRDGFLVPSEGLGNGTLVWERAKFENTELFDKMRTSFKAGLLRVYAKPTRIVFIDGSSIQEPT